MSQRFASVKIGSFHLTDTGTASGLACRAFVENVEALAETLAVVSTPTLGGVKTQINQVAFGQTFTILINRCSETHLTQIRSLIRTALQNAATIAVEASNYVAFKANAMLQTNEQGAWFTFEGRSGGFLNNVRLRFMVVSFYQ